MTAHAGSGDGTPRAVRVALLAVALVATAAPAARADIEHDSDTDNGIHNESVLTFDATVAAGDDRYLLVGVTTSGGTALVQSATFAGAPLGFLGATTADAAACRVEWWGLVAPPVGTSPFRVEAATRTPYLNAALVSYRGVAQLGSVGAVVSTRGTAVPSAVTVPSAPGEVVLDAVCGGLAPTSLVLIAGPDQVARWHWSTDTISSAGSQKAGAPSVTMTWTFSGPGAPWGAAGISLRPAGTRVSVDLGVGTAGCTMGGGRPRPGSAAFAAGGVWLLGAGALRRWRRRRPIVGT